MNLVRGKYRSNKTMKRALHLKQQGSDGTAARDYRVPTPLTGLVRGLKKAFGSSKHRNARTQRFQARQRRSGRRG